MNHTNNRTPTAIRVIPMSIKLEFPTKQSVEDFFINELPKRQTPGEFRLRESTINAERGTLLLFQYDAQIIGEAELLEVRSFDTPVDRVYRGSLVLDMNTLRLFEPAVTHEEFQSLWGRRLGQARHSLEVAKIDEWRNLTASRIHGS